MARNGATKKEIRKYVEWEFHYDLSRSLDEIRPSYHHVESCQETVPEAITAFLEADDFEDALRNAVSLGGDTDTLAAITGSIAEAFFGIPEVFKAECRNRIDPEMNRVLDAFDEVLGICSQKSDERMQGNELIENAIDNLYEMQDNDSFVDVITALCFRMKRNGCGMVPFVTVGGTMFPDLDVSSLKKGDVVTLDHEVRFRMDTVAAGDGVEWFYIFTSEEEMHKKPVPEVIMEIPFADIFDIAGKNDKVAGVVINPFGRYFKADREVIECINAVFQNMED
ncbi:hypothetical protein EAI89_20275 [Eubacterium sp. am_0171]|uniref:ADP-ribosylglycohydrolase family protein n=1 Tax=unclassified Eubacterium (in: firmicutes) TaxID=2624479 RepID=UPI001020B374|nr:MULTISPECIES: ADP-ribosylglycohydrolase family protein [unclassified Eubacterium (in: firmicutes)]MSC86183.1 hypothetical protein [Eubacterium sp. BIOML-A1]MSD08508.1 hypothetical protein [Eubacterium sp. BIOML-A2]RYT12127.1 hypothetical protein EAI89_20275 [Eubacterium sp. am_0171]